MGARKQYSSINFYGGIIEGISLILIINVRDFSTDIFGDAQSLSSTHRFLLLISPRSLNDF